MHKFVVKQTWKNGSLFEWLEYFILKVAGDIKARIIDREIIKQPYTEQPGAYKILGSSKWDEVTHQELKNIVDFYDKQSQDTDVHSRYP